MSVQLQQIPSMLETGNQLTSPRNSGNTRDNVRISAYEKAVIDLTHDKKLERDLAVGRQIGLYRIRGELGSGNFSQVKLGIHILTRGCKHIYGNSVRLSPSLCLSNFNLYTVLCENGLKKFTVTLSIPPRSPTISVFSYQTKFWWATSGSVKYKQMMKNVLTWHISTVRFFWNVKDMIV